MLKLAPLRLGRVKIAFPIGQAALSGYSDWPMRLIAGRLGAGFTVAEVLLDRFVLDVSKGKKAKRLIRVTDQERPCGAQLMGSTAEDLTPAAVKLVEAGFDWIDINFACPVKKVLGRHRGGYLLGRVDTALGIVARVRDALPCEVPLTVKMRRGTDDGPESRRRFLAIFDGAFDLGAAAVTVHSRTVRQRYEGAASWEFLREVKQRAGDRIVFGSGDLFSAQSCLDMMTQTGVDGVTVARGAIGNPWIFRQVRALAAGEPLPGPPSLSQQRDLITLHYRLAEQTYGPHRAASHMRKIGIRYAQLHPQSQQVRDAFVAVRHPEQWKDLLQTWYPEGSLSRHP